MVFQRRIPRESLFAPSSNGWHNLFELSKEDGKEYLKYLNIIHDFSVTFQGVYAPGVVAFFEQHLAAVLKEVNSFEELDRYFVRMDIVTLPNLFERFGIDQKHYEIRTRWKSVFTSVLIQRRVQLKIQRNPSFFEEKKAELLKMLEEDQPRFVDWPESLMVQDQELASVTRFFIALQEAASIYKPNRFKWERMGFFTAAMSTGENINFCHGGGEKKSTKLRRQLFFIMEHHRYRKLNNTNRKKDEEIEVETPKLNKKSSAQKRTLPAPDDDDKKKNTVGTKTVKKCKSALDESQKTTSKPKHRLLELIQPVNESNTFRKNDYQLPLQCIAFPIDDLTFSVTTACSSPMTVPSSPVVTYETKAENEEISMEELAEAAAMAAESEHYTTDSDDSDDDDGSNTPMSKLDQLLLDCFHDETLMHFDHSECVYGLLSFLK